MVQPREGALLLAPTLVTPVLFNAVSQPVFFFCRATFLIADVGNSVVPASDPVTKLIIGLLGIVVSPTVIVGLTCSPLSVTGVGGSSW